MLALELISHNLFNDLVNTEKRKFFVKTAALHNRIAAFTPAVNFTELENFFHLNVDLPGLKIDDISLQIEGRKLTVRGERKISVPEQTTRSNLIERWHGKFEREFLLPENVDAEKVTARLEDGVLLVELQKSTPSQLRKIEVVAN